MAHDEPEQIRVVASSIDGERIHSNSSPETVGNLYDCQSCLERPFDVWMKRWGGEGLAALVPPTDSQGMR